jgi:hypothetical protein
MTLVRATVAKERITSIARVERIDELGTTLALTSNLSTLGRKPQILEV